MMNIGRDHHDLFPRSTSVDRDYADTPPSRGVLRGNGGSVLSTDVRIERHPGERPRMQHSEERGRRCRRSTISPSSSPLGPSSFSRSGRAADDQAKGHRNSNEVSGHGGPAPWGYAETEGPEFWGALAVVGVMMQAGRHNDPLASVFASMPAEAGPEVEIADTAVDASAMQPPDSGAYFPLQGLAARRRPAARECAGSCSRTRSR